MQICGGSSGGRTPQALPAVESAGPASHQEVSSRSGDAELSHFEVIKCLVRKAGFLREVAEDIALDLRFHSSSLSGKVVSIPPLVFMDGISLPTRPLFHR